MFINLAISILIVIGVVVAILSLALSESDYREYCVRKHITRFAAWTVVVTIILCATLQTASAIFGTKTEEIQTLTITQREIIPRLLSGNEHTSCVFYYIEDETGITGSHTVYPEEYMGHYEDVNVGDKLYRTTTTTRFLGLIAWQTKTVTPAIDDTTTN